jgi:hypothetical protein
MTNDNLPSTKKLLQGLDVDAASSNHPGIDLLLYVFEYVVQLLGVYVSCPLVIAAEGNVDAIDTSVFSLLLSTALLAAEFAMDAFDAEALSTPRFSALRNAFWGLSVTAVADVVLIILLACTDASGVAFFIAWVFCFVRSVIAPACLIKYQFDLFIAYYDRTRDGIGG